MAAHVLKVDWRCGTQRQPFMSAVSICEDITRPRRAGYVLTLNSPCKIQTTNGELKFVSKSKWGVVAHSWRGGMGSARLLSQARMWSRAGKQWVLWEDNIATKALVWPSQILQHFFLSKTHSCVISSYPSKEPVRVVGRFAALQICVTLLPLPF